jgi:hypothetical protein
MQILAKQVWQIGHAGRLLAWSAHFSKLNNQVSKRKEKKKLASIMLARSLIDLDQLVEIGSVLPGACGRLGRPAHMFFFFLFLFLLPSL